MTSGKNWTRQQQMVALYLYQVLPFGLFDRKNSNVIKYSKLIGRTPDALAMKLSNFASLDPAITETGRIGLRGASKSDEKIWAEMNSNWSAFTIEIDKAVKAAKNLYQANTGLSFDTSEVVIPDPDFTGEERITKNKVRVGQSYFRKAVLSSYNNKCCMSGLSLPKLLVASHIIPWKDNIENRLHPRNGLSLSMIHDKAFDQGIITVTANLKILVSTKYHSKDDDFFNLALLKFNGKDLHLPSKYRPKLEFLEWHRDNVFETKPA